MAVKPKRYRKKPVIIEAILYTGSNLQDILNFVGDGSVLSWRDNRLSIHTLEGDMYIHPGNYIIKGVNGEFYPIDKDIFDKTYDPVGEEPR